MTIAIFVQIKNTEGGYIFREKYTPPQYNCILRPDLRCENAP